MGTDDSEVLFALVFFGGGEGEMCARLQSVTWQVRNNVTTLEEVKEKLSSR